MHQAQVNILPRKFLTQGVRLTASIASHIRSLLHIRQSNEFHIRARLEHGPKALQRGVDRATQRRCSHQLDIGVVREVVAQLAALLVAEICEEGVRDDVVGGAEVVDALGEVAISAIVDGILSRVFSNPRLCTVPCVMIGVGMLTYLGVADAVDDRGHAGLGVSQGHRFLQVGDFVNLKKTDFDFERPWR